MLNSSMISNLSDAATCDLLTATAGHVSFRALPTSSTVERPSCGGSHDCSKHYCSPTDEGTHDCDKKCSALVDYRHSGCDHLVQIRCWIAWVLHHRAIGTSMWWKARNWSICHTPEPPCSFVLENYIHPECLHPVSILCAASSHFKADRSSKFPVACNKLIPLAKLCGHVIDVKCYESASGVLCPQMCDLMMDCGKHKCCKPCHPPHSHTTCEAIVADTCNFCSTPGTRICSSVINCRGNVTVRFRRCGHKRVIACSVLVKCIEVCKLKMTCDIHKCGKRCHPRHSHVACRALVSDTCSNCGTAGTRECSSLINCQHKVSITFPNCHHKRAIACSDRAKSKCADVCGQPIDCLRHVCERPCASNPHSHAVCGAEISEQCANGHMVKYPCSGVKQRCCVRMEKVFPTCNHKRMVECWELGSAVCVEPCGQRLRCLLHPCEQPCQPKHSHSCTVVRTYTASCGHIVTQKCGTIATNCKQPCKQQRYCGHPCMQMCHEDCDGCVCTKCRNLLLPTPTNLDTFCTVPSARAAPCTVPSARAAPRYSYTVPPYHQVHRYHDQHCSSVDGEIVYLNLQQRYGLIQQGRGYAMRTGFNFQFDVVENLRASQLRVAVGCKVEAYLNTQFRPQLVRVIGAENWEESASSAGGIRGLVVNVRPGHHAFVKAFSRVGNGRRQRDVYVSVNSVLRYLLPLARGDEVELNVNLQDPRGPSAEEVEIYKFAQRKCNELINHLNTLASTIRWDNFVDALSILPMWKYFSDLQFGDSRLQFYYFVHLLHTVTIAIKAAKARQDLCVAIVDNVVASPNFEPRSHFAESLSRDGLSCIKLTGNIMKVQTIIKEFICISLEKNPIHAKRVLPLVEKLWPNTAYPVRSAVAEMSTRRELFCGGSPFLDSRWGREFRNAKGHFEDRFRKLGSNSNVYVRSIEVLSNSKLETRFAVKKALFVSGGIPDNIKVCYHGTDSSNVAGILRDSLQMKFARTQSFGPGMYLSEYPDISMQYGNTLLQCDVLPGVQMDHGLSLRTTSYNSVSVQQGYGSHPEMVIIKDSDQILPRYIINLSK